MDIIYSEEYVKISKEGILDDGCAEAWSNILDKNAKAAKDLSYVNQSNDFRGLNAFLKEFILVRGSLLKLSFCVDDECITYLKSKGYDIDTTNGITYAESLNRALKKSESINSKISIRRNNMIKKYGEGKDEGRITCEELVAGLNLALKGAYVNRNVLLCEYNAYKNSLRKK